MTPWNAGWRRVVAYPFMVAALVALTALERVTKARRR